MLHCNIKFVNNVYMNGDQKMLLQDIIQKLQKLWKNWSMSPEERWLADSADIIELEHKLHALNSPKHNFFSN